MLLNFSDYKLVVSAKERKIKFFMLETDNFLSFN